MRHLNFKEHAKKESINLISTYAITPELLDISIVPYNISNDIIILNQGVLNTEYRGDCNSFLIGY